MRDVDDILLFRGDISPFLAHLTRNLDGQSAEHRLESILQSRELLAGPTEISDARFGGNTLGMTPDARTRMFGAVCFTETPLSEVHCLLEIAGREVNLEPYGLVFVKDRLKLLGVAPVIYLNNERADADPIVQAIFSLRFTAPGPAERLLPLVAVFGHKFHPPGALDRPTGHVDFSWEREWRYPASRGPFAFRLDDVFCGLCPQERIAHFEATYQPLRFIDPRRSMKWYANSLVACRQRLNLKYSVV